MSELDPPNAEETGAHHNTEALQVPNLIKINSQQQRVFTDKDWGEYESAGITNADYTQHVLRTTNLIASIANGYQ